MEGQQVERKLSTDELLDKLRALGAPEGGRYSLDSKVITLWMVLSLVQVDKDHRPFSVTTAMNRAVGLVPVSLRTMQFRTKELREGEGELGEGRKLGRPVCPHHSTLLSAKQIGKLRLWIWERRGQQKGQPNLKVKHIQHHLEQTWKIVMSKEAVKEMVVKMGFQ